MRRAGWNQGIQCAPWAAQRLFAKMRRRASIRTSKPVRKVRTVPHSSQLAGITLSGSPACSNHDGLGQALLHDHGPFGEFKVHHVFVAHFLKARRWARIQVAPQRGNHRCVACDVGQQVQATRFA